MSRVQLGLAVWGGLLVVFLALELPAVFHLVPWPTLSAETAAGEAWWEPLRLCVVAILFVLALHLAFRLSALPLIVVAAGTAAGLLLHFLD